MQTTSSNACATSTPATLLGAAGDAHKYACTVASMVNSVYTTFTHSTHEHNTLSSDGARDGHYNGGIDERRGQHGSLSVGMPIGGIRLAWVRRIDTATHGRADNLCRRHT
jgi:hypothetical protein